MLKKILSIALAVVMIVSVAAFATSCGNTAGDNNSETTVADNKANDGKEFKVGFIFLHDENSTYDLNFINAVKGAQAATGLTDSQVIMKTNIPERVRSATRLVRTLSIRAARSSLQTASVTRLTSSRLLRSTPMFSSAMLPVQELTPRVFPTITMHLLLFTRVVILQALPQVLSSTR